jgi:hypothetical protein
MRPDTASSASYSPLTSTQWALDEPLDPLVGYVTGISHYGPTGVPSYATPLQPTPTQIPLTSPFDGIDPRFNLFHTASTSMTTPRHDGISAMSWDQPSSLTGAPQATGINSAGSLNGTGQTSLLACAHGFGYTANQPVSPSTAMGSLFTEQLFPNSDALYHQAIDSMQPHSLQEVLSMNRSLQQQHGTLPGGVEQVPLSILGQIGQENPQPQAMPASQQQEGQTVPPTQMMDWWTTAYLEQEFRDRTDRTDNELPRHSI